MIREGEIPGLFSQTPNLTKFHLGLVYHWGKEFSLVNGAAIFQGLHSVSRTIENLSFYLEYYPTSLGEYYFNEKDIKRKEPFKNFPLQSPKLWFVEVPIIVLLGTDPATSVDVRMVLPSTIQ